MREEYFYWEVVISVRKLLLVVGTKMSSGHTVPSTLWNLFVTVAALGAHVWKWPFAHNDANLAEALTLLSTLAVLALGLGQNTTEETDDLRNIEPATCLDNGKVCKGAMGACPEGCEGSPGACAGTAKCAACALCARAGGTKEDCEKPEGCVYEPSYNRVTALFNNVVYVLMFFFVAATLFILARRVAGVWFNLRHRNDFKTQRVSFKIPSNYVRYTMDAKYLLWWCRSGVIGHFRENWRFEPIQAVDSQAAIPTLAAEVAVAVAVTSGVLRLHFTATADVLMTVGWIALLLASHCCWMLVACVIRGSPSSEMLGDRRILGIQLSVLGFVTLSLALSLVFMLWHMLADGAPRPSPPICIFLCIPGPVVLMASHLVVAKNYDPQAEAHPSSQRFMATKRNMVYSDKLGTRPCGFVYAGQIIHVKATYRTTDRSPPLAMLQCEFGWVQEKANSLRSPTEDHGGCCCRWWCCCCCFCCDYCLDTQEEDEQPRTQQNVAFDTLFIAEHDECLYFTVNRETALGKEFKAFECRIDPLNPSLRVGGGDVVKMLGKPTLDTESGQMRLEVANPDAEGSLGWISQEKEHMLSNDVRAVLHKSKLNVAAVWAAAYAEGEDLRRMEDVFRKIEDWRRDMDIRQDKRWHQHFPAKLRPAIYSWLTSAPPEETEDLKWFMEELHIAETEQLRVLPCIIGTSAANALELSSLPRRLKCLNQQGSSSGSGQNLSVELPMNPRGSVMNPYVDSGKLDAPLVVDDAEATQEMRQSMRLSRVLRVSSAPAGPGFLARVQDFAYMMHDVSTATRSLIAATALLIVCMYAALIVAIVENTTSTIQCNGEISVVANPTSIGSVGGSACPTLIASVWLVGVGVLYIVVPTLMLNLAGHTTIAVALCLGAVVGASMGWVAQYLLRAFPRFACWQAPGLPVLICTLLGALTVAVLSIGMFWVPTRTRGHFRATHVGSE